MIKTVGKFQMENRTTESGQKVTMITGIADGHLIQNALRNNVLAELELPVARALEGNQSSSPEDFLENIDSINWAEVFKEGAWLI